MKRSYTIILTNCDCGSDIIARTSTKWMMGPRCPGCHQVLGPMSWRDDGKVMASGDLEACRIYVEQRRAKARQGKEGTS